MLKRYFSNGPRRCERKTSVLLQCGQGLLMFNFILKVLSPPVVRGGWDQPQHSVYAAALTEFKSAYVKSLYSFSLRLRLITLYPKSGPTPLRFSFSVPRYSG